MREWLPTRDTRPELMDDLDLGGVEIEGALNGIEKVNRWLGGYLIVLKALKIYLKQTPHQLDRPLRIVDLGCGGGDTLRYLARYFRKFDSKVELIGVDANEHVLTYACRESENFSEITYKKAEALHVPDLPEGDIYLCSLFLHHFTDEEIISLLQQLLSLPSTQCILINDLHRNRMAFVLFQIWSRLFRISGMARHDGLLSIRKAFRRSDLESYLRACNCKDYHLKWRWAFRWQMLLFNSNHECTQ